MAEINKVQIKDTTYDIKDVISGYQTEFQVKNIVEGYNYQNKDQVENIIKSKGFTTMSEVEAKGYQDEVDVEGIVLTRLTSKQDKLVSGTNIKTINNMPILGSGNIEIQGGGGSSAYNGKLTIKRNGSTVGSFTANQQDDTDINITVPTKTSQIQNDSNFVYQNDLNGKQNKLTAGSNITISDEDVISAVDTTYDLVESNVGSMGLMSGSDKIILDSLPTRINAKQDTLVSGTNIKTINNKSILGNGNIEIEEGTTPNNGTLTIKRNGTKLGTFSADQASDTDININVPINTNELINGAGYLKQADLQPVAKTNNYNDLDGRPTALSQFTDDLGNSPAHSHSQYLTAAAVSKVGISGDYKDLTNQPEIPSIDGLATEQWVEEQGYLKEHQDISNLATKEEVAEKQNILTAGTNIAISNDTVSLNTKHEPWTFKLEDGTTVTKEIVLWN